MTAKRAEVKRAEVLAVLGDLFEDEGFLVDREWTRDSIRVLSDIETAYVTMVPTKYSDEDHAVEVEVRTDGRLAGRLRAILKRIGYDVGTMRAFTVKSGWFAEGRGWNFVASWLKVPEART
jgi:chloramphenicol 3-O-phosphotransferase